MTVVVTSNGFSNVKSVISKRERKGKLVVDINFRRGMTLDAKYSLMSELHKAVERIIEEKN